MCLFGLLTLTFLIQVSTLLHVAATLTLWGLFILFDFAFHNCLFLFGRSCINNTYAWGSKSCVREKGIAHTSNLDQTCMIEGWNDELRGRSCTISRRVLKCLPPK